MEVNLKYIVYCTINLINSKIYIGVHKTNDPSKFDGYIGCGVLVNQPNTYQKPKTHFQFAVKKYGPKNFKRITLAVFNSLEEASDLEAHIVDEAFLKRSDVYNMVLGGVSDVGKSMRIKTYQYDLTGKYKAEYESIWAAAKAVNRDQSAVNYAIIHKGACAGYYWSTDKVNSLDLSNYTKGDPQAKKVYLYKITGEFIKEFSTMQACVKELSPNSVSTGSTIRPNLLFGIPYLNYKVSYVKAETFDVANSIYTQSRVVYRYKSDGTFDKEYETQKLAEEENPGSNISKAIKLKKLCANNFYWGLNKVPQYGTSFRPNRGVKKVGKYDTMGNLIKIYNSITEAAKENGGRVWKVLDKEGTSKNYKFKTILN